MSVIVQTVINTGKLNSLRKCLNLSFKSCNCLSIRKSSDVPKRFASFDEVVAQRRAEARRSLVVQVNSEASFNELYGYCSKYSSINGVHHYKNSGGEHFMLIEFSTEDNLNDIVRTCTSYQRDVDVMAVQSPFLWFRAMPGNKENYTVPDSVSLLTKDGIEPVDDDIMYEELAGCSSVSEQVQVLHDRTVLNDLGVRLRYLVARQVECLFMSLYSNIAVRPFGSSVNGFGKMGCDLDLSLTHVPEDEMASAARRLVYQQRAAGGGGGAGGGGARGGWQAPLELAALALELRLAGAARVQRVLHARVPILKFAHHLADLDCDLCYNNMSGLYMSELLWLLGSLDPRVRPLTSAVRRWARAAALTNPHPGRWITNFPLTLMVLFFLQQKGKDGSILPPLKTLVRKAGKEDIRIAEENLNCTFLRDLNKLPTDSYGQNHDNLEMLLLQFFEFYAQFDFQDKAISINEGIPVRKPNSLPLYIVNPLEQTLNVSRNVSYEECERLKHEVRNAAWLLDAGMDGQKTEDWGLLGLIERKSTRSLKKLLKVGNSHRLISVKDLFQDDEENKSGLDSDIKKNTPKSNKEIESSVREMKASIVVDGKEKDQKNKFKNSQIASEVYRIRRDKIV